MNEVSDLVIQDKIDKRKRIMATGETIIIAPHPDDECIGCYEVLNSGVKCIIIYTSDVDNNRKEEALRLKNHTNIKGQMFIKSIPSNLLHPSNIYYFPHPIYETHPDHRIQGIAGEQLARSGFNVIFYITEMNAPFKFECKTSEKKEGLLNEIYKSQRSMWEYEKKYILFSGYDKWVFNTGTI